MNHLSISLMLVEPDEVRSILKLQLDVGAIFKSVLNLKVQIDRKMVWILHECFV